MFTALTREERTELEDRSLRQGAGTPVSDHLFLVLECARPLTGGLRCSMTGVHEVLIGRGERREILRESRPEGDRVLIRVPDRRMSQRHARLVRASNGYHLRDEGSTNGSLLNGRAITEAPVHDGALIELGRTFFTLRTQVRTPASMPPDVDTESLLNADTLSPSLQADLDVLARVAKSAMSILLLGETGTGKEVLARWVHAASDRAGSLVPVNCAAIPDTLVESELFGQEKGAYTGAQEKKGYVRSADRGTLLLDEIGDMPLDSQVKLLRVMQERTVYPIGQARPLPIAVDVRFIGATHAPLAELVTKGKFRGDLLARFSGHTHRLAALRDRKEDLGLLLTRIAAELPNAAGLQLSVSAGRALLGYAWPMNVRELRQVLERAIILCGHDAVELEHLPDEVAAYANAELLSEDGITPVSTLSESEQQLRAQLVAALTEHQGNVSKVAQALNKERMQVYRWLKSFELHAAQFRG